MSAARIRSALAQAIKSFGFERSGSELVLRQPELEHVVSAYAIRRLTGFFEVVHSVFESESIRPRDPLRSPLVQDRIRGFMEPYLDAWHMERFDPALASRQIAAIVGAFSSHHDVAHFHSDRPSAGGIVGPPTVASTQAPRSLSQAQEVSALRFHSNAIFASHFAPAPRLGIQMWAHRQEVGGYRYCSYLMPNDTATFATLMYFAFSSRDIDKGRRSDEVVRLLYGARKRLLSEAGLPVLVPLVSGGIDHASLTDLLLRVLSENPANCLPRDDA